MKKRLITIAAVVVLTTVSLALAQMNDKGKDMMGGGMMDGKGGMMGMMGKGMMGDKSGMMGMHSMMMKMMEKLMVPTEDGGVVVLFGNKLTKYDKDLNVVKEVEIKMDMEGMHKNMDDMMKMCPMMGKGMKEGMSKKDDDDDEAAEAAEHASHHPENK